MRSMTGFGRGEASGADGTLAFRVEISSVNRKQFELKFNLPRDMASCEGLLRQAVAARISRGALTLQACGHRAARRGTHRGGEHAAQNDSLLSHG